MKRSETSANSPHFARLYVWELPVRIFHWVNAACIFALIGTGFLIGYPIALTWSREAYFQNSFGLVRFVHFVAAYILVINYLMRIYWSFVGNKYAHWRTFIPTTKEDFVEIWNVIRTDILQTKLEGKISIGHNKMASLIYLVLLVALILQTITGFGMYAAMSTAMFPKLFGWVIWLFGNEMNVRFLHHLLMWFFILFTIVHVYLVFYHDYIEGRSTTSSMAGGWKFERVDILEEEKKK